MDTDGDLNLELDSQIHKLEDSEDSEEERDKQFKKVLTSAPVGYMSEISPKRADNSSDRKSILVSLN